MSGILDQIEQWAGELRGKTFRAAAEWVLKHKPKVIVETGCYRGGDCDGRSTLILAALAKEIGCSARSFDNNPEHIKLAVELLERHGLQQHLQVILSDSITALSLTSEEIGFLYGDSYDFGATEPLKCQMHQLAEIGGAYGKLNHQCAVLLDDYELPSQGKCGLSVPFLKERGWTVAAEGYQILLTRE